MRQITDPTEAHADAVAGSRRAWTLLLASMGSFLAALDVVVVATALPVLRTDLGASLADLEWTLNAYNLTFACLMMTGAALGDRYGRRRTYVVGLGVFAATSAGAALSSTSGELIAARVLQGAGAAVVLPLSLALITDAFPAGKRAAAIGVWGGVSGLGVAAGPVIGGAITEGIAWPWIFWLNVPVGIVVMLLSTVLIRETHGPRPQVDIVGLVLVGIGLFSLTWAPVRAPEIGWSSGEVIGALVVGAMFAAVFVAWERRAPYPMVPVSYFRSRGFTTANGVIFFQFVSLIGSLFMISQFFQIGLGYSPLEAGLRILVWMAMPLLVAPVAGGLAGRFGNKPFMLLGLLLQAVGLGWLALVVELGVGYGVLVVPLIIAGAGIAMCFPTTANAVIESVPLPDSAVAAGANSALREVGGVFGVAVLAAVFAAHGSYATPASFIAGFQPAMMVAAVVPLAGVLAAALAPSKSAVSSAPASGVRPRQPEL